MTVTHVNSVMVGEPLVFEFTVYEEMAGGIWPLMWGAPTNADALPDIYVYRGPSFNTHVTTDKMVQDNVATGRYWYEVVPDAVDTYHAAAVFKVSGNGRSWEWRADVLGDPGATQSGSDGSGQIVSMYFYDRPEVDHVLYETAQGQIVAKQNPS